MRFITTKQNQNDYLAHHGIKGQKWGVRRFQNENGSLTPAGRERYGYGDANRQESSREVLDNNRVKAEKEKSEEELKRLARIVQQEVEYKKYLKENKKSLLSDARKNDKWEERFLEVMQDEPEFDDVARMLKEYDVWLDDPHAWYISKHHIAQLIR